MFLPILSSTVVTVAVFLPLGFVQGTVGELFLPFALTIVFALAASLLIAITVVPMLTHTLFKRKAVKKTGSEGEPWRLARSYKKVLNWSLNHKWITFGMAILLLVGSLFLVPLIGVSFLPSDEQKMVIATFNPAVGESKQDAEKTAAMAEDFFLNRKGVHTVQYSLGGENPVNPGASNQALFFVEYDKDTPNFDQESERVIKELNRKTEKGEWGTLDMSSTGSNNLELYVYGNDEKDIKDAVKQVTHEMEKEKNLTDIDSGLARAYDQYTLVLDQEKLSQYGLTAGQVGASLSSVGEQNALTTLKVDGKDVNVYVQAKKGTYTDVNDLLDTEIPTPLGGNVKLSDISDVKNGKAQETITRRDGKLYTSVQAKVKTNDVGKMSADLQKKIDKMDLPDGVSVEFGGVTQQINESFSQLGLAMLAAIAIVYFVLVVTFGNGLAPFAILFSLPFTVIGGFLALYLTGETISISAMIGALMLIGIVVANAIVLIDRTTRKQEEGLSTREALLEAAGTRLRPILMTAIATIGALLPLAFGMEGSGLISKGLGVTVIGGLASSTLLTLLIVPIVYEFLMKFRRKHPAADE
jgi:HAE1 family hydrophobic/amphiphilic exporter-1